MTSLKTVERRMLLLEQAGVGEFLAVDTSDLRAPIFIVSFERVSLRISRRGVNIQRNGVDEFVGFDELQGIDSVLTAELFSNASHASSEDRLFPMRLRMREAVVILEVPLMAYSGLMNILLSLKELDAMS